MQPSTSYISNLTSLRGITALLVGVYHFQGLFVRFIPESTTMFFAKCYLMVDIFFIMSGLIITHVYQNSFRHEVAGADFWKFIVARFARIYPLHFVVLLVIVISFLASGAPPDPIQNPVAIPSNLLLIHSFGIHDSFTWNVPSWSISAEWWCYMLFPLLIWLLDRGKRLTIPLFLLASVMAYLSIMYWLPRAGPDGAPLQQLPHDLNVTFDYGFLRGLAGFVIGMLLYKLYEMPGMRSRFRSDWLLVLFMVLAIACLHFAGPDIVAIPLFAGIVMCAACNDGAIHRLFERPILQLVGDVSYSIYMWHIVILFGGIQLLGALGMTFAKPPFSAVPFWAGFAGCATFLIVVVLLSILSYRYVEKPCRDFINRRSRRALTWAR